MNNQLYLGKKCKSESVIKCVTTKYKEIYLLNPKKTITEIGNTVFKTCMEQPIMLNYF